MGEMKKVAACKVKPYKLIERDQESTNETNETNYTYKTNDNCDLKANEEDDCSSVWNCGQDDEIMDIDTDSNGPHYMRMENN